MPPTPAQTEDNLRSLGAAYRRRADGMYVVEHDIKLSYQGLNELPDLSSVIVKGSFTIAANNLTSLKGCPREVGGDFWCHHNALTSLEGCPSKVAGNFWCHENNLTSLAHAPESVGGYFYCDKNQLTSLEGAPKTFIRIDSDFGSFKSWDEVPERLRRSPEIQRQEAEEKAGRETLERLRKIAHDRPVKIKKPAIK